MQPELNSISKRYRWLMERMTIRNEAGLYAPMRFVQSQEILWSHIAPLLDANEKIRVIVLKARQIYATTFFQGLIFVHTITRPGSQSLVFAQDMDTTREIFEMAKRFYENLPLPKIVPTKVREIILPFAGGTSTFKVASAGVGHKGRGTTKTCIQGSETAFWPFPEIWTGLAQSLPDLPGTIGVLESTANGKVGYGELFYNEWQSAVAGESSYIPIFIPWYYMNKYRGSAPGINRAAVPESEWDDDEKILHETLGLDGDQIAWRRYIIPAKCQNDLDIFNQEYPSTPQDAFITTGLPAFSRQALLFQQPFICKPIARGYFKLEERKPTFVESSTGEVRIWKMPELGHQYVIGVDTSEGLGSDRPVREALQQRDFSCAEIIDMADLEQVASIHGTMPPWDLAQAINLAGLWYNTAIICVEVNNHGHVVQDHLVRTHQYPNMHPWRGKPDRVDRGKVRLYGWETNTWSRPLLIASGRRAIDTKLVTIHEEKLLNELHEFSKNDYGRYVAEAGHDDRVIALLLALRSRDENYYGAKRIEVAMSDELDIPGVRIVEVPSDQAKMRRHIGRALREFGQKAVKGWLEL